MFLAVTPAQEFWDMSEEMLFIGPWCARYEFSGELKNIRHRFLPDPFKDLARFTAADEYCRKVSGYFLGEMSTYLNKIHGTTPDARYWRLLLDPWLTFHIEQMYSHFVYVEDAFRLEPGLKTILLDPACYETPRGTEDFVRQKLTDRFHLQIFSQILSARLPGSPKQRLDAPSTPAPRARLKGFLKSVAAQAFGMLTALGAGSVLLSEIEMRREELLRLVIGSRLKALPYLGELPEPARPAPVHDARRLGLANLSAHDEFERVFVAALPWQMPTILLEGYEEARRATLANLPRAPKVFFSSVGWHFIDASKFAAAECAARGVRLWGIQHGGSYGMAEHSPTELIERALCDRYYTWGWSKTDPDPRLRDLPSPLLSRVGSAVLGGDLLFVSTILDFHNIRLARDSNGAAAFACLERQGRFLRTLTGPAREHALMRLYWHDFGWRQRDRLRAMVPDLSFDEYAVPFAQRLREARLVVLDCPSTPMLEVLAADAPCVMTWAPDTWTFRPSARPFFDALRTAGILFDSPEKAAAQASLAYADPRAWWDQPARRTARSEFVDAFARSSPTWAEAWLKEIRSA